MQPLAFPAYFQLLLAALFTTVFILASDFSYDGSNLTGAFAMLGILAVCAWCARWLSFCRLAGGVESMVLLTAISFIAPICAALLASTARPLADPLLLNLDRFLFFGFDRTTMIPRATEWPPLLLEATRLVYHSLLLQPYLLLAVLFLCRLERVAWVFVTAWTTALILSVAVFPLLPAMGTPPYSLEFAATFEGVRDGSIRVVDLRSLTGIITFPSFHAAGAVLLGWGFAQVKGAAFFFVPLNILLFASALFAGGHYLVDLAAGGFVAILAIKLSTHAQRLIDRRRCHVPRSKVGLFGRAVSGHFCGKPRPVAQPTGR